MVPGWAATQNKEMSLKRGPKIGQRSAMKVAKITVSGIVVARVLKFRGSYTMAIT